MKFCECDAPIPGADPRHQNSCLRCSRAIDFDADWQINDRTHLDFLNRVERALADVPDDGWPKKKPPADWLHFRSLALGRERAGRERFGYEYLTRDNIAAGAEESTDGINYTYMDLLQARHRNEPEEWGLILQAAYHDFMAYRTRIELRRRHKGAP